jgi:hypothetical protein
MLRIPVASLPLPKQKMLASCTSVPRLYISIERFRFACEIQAVVYEIQIGVQQNQDVIVHTVNLRFSQMEKLHQSLSQRISLTGSNLRFPVKRWFGNTNEQFLKQRADNLQKYFSDLLQIRGMGGNHALRKLFQIDNEMK